LPTDEVLARSSVLQSGCADGVTVTVQARTPKSRFSESLRKLATHFRAAHSSVYVPDFEGIRFLPTP
jgi:hypothetical protein